MPREEGYWIINKDGFLYLVFSDKKYAKELFKKGSDGFAVDVIKREQYSCSGPNQTADSWAYEGTLLPPLFKKDFEKAQEKDGWYWIPYQKLPAEFDPNNIEYNLLIAQSKWLCEYRKVTNGEFTNWSLLPTGLYRDSIPETVGEEFKYLQKKVSFEIPFQKDQSQFDSTFFKPVYDSLNFTDFAVTHIKIQAFASVEGTLERNIKLQESRAQNIVNALQAYQTERVTSEVSAEENWEEFRRQMAGTRFPEFATLPKTEVKSRIANDKELAQTLEPLLAGHRKAQIEITLEKRLTLKTDDPDKLKAFFQQRINEKNIEEAIFIQNAIFQKVKDEKLPEDFIDELEIPQSLQYTPVLNNKAIFKNEQEVTSLEESLGDFMRLLELMPDNNRIQYNVVATKTKLWSQTNNRTYGADIDARLKLLEKSALDKSLVARLRMNYNILLIEYLDLAKQYRRKPRILNQIFKSYQQTNLTDEERLGLAKYMVRHSRQDNARSIMETRVYQPGSSMDLRYYYMSITMYSRTFLKDPKYLRLMDKTLEANPLPFCDYLRPLPQQGLSFQLLGQPELKERYCNVCSGNTP
ncbi:MAG: hypothetical protein Roseis2KO_50630 [Roseivirga sp.]